MSIDELEESFGRICTGGSPHASQLVEPGRFRRALKPVEGSMIAIANRRASFCNPGIRDFLGGVILADRLFWPLLSRLSSFAEIDSAWAFYCSVRAQLRGHGGEEAEWLAALQRAHSSGEEFSHIRLISLVLQVTAEFEDNDEQLMQFLASLMLQLRAMPVTPTQSFDDMYFRHALEYLNTMSVCQRRRIQDVDAIVETAADYLANEGSSLWLDDIEMLADAIGLYGDRPDLKRNAATSAVQNWITYSLKDVVDDLKSSEELEETVSGLLKLTESLDIKLGVLHSAAIETKREKLAEKEDWEESQGYQISRPVTPERDFSDEQAKSLFSTIFD